MAMNETEADRVEPLEMHVPKWSIQWAGVRFLWSLLVVGVVIQIKGSVNVSSLASLCIGLATFGALSALAWFNRRRWAIKHSYDDGTDLNP